MFSRAKATFVSLCFTALCFSQVSVDENPLITYSTPAVRAALAVDDIGRMTEKKIRVAAPLDQQPLILHLHAARYSDVMDWIATTLNGSWIDENGYKVLHRSNFVTLSLKNALQRERARAILNAVDERQRQLAKAPLTEQLAVKTILTLHDATATEEQKQTALMNSAGERLIGRALSALVPSDLTSAPYPDHVAFSTNPRILQGRLRMTAKELNNAFAEQNLWTKTLNQLAKTHPEFKSEANARLPIEAKSRIVLVLSDVQNGIPTHISASIVGPGGHARLRAESKLKIDAPEMAASGIDWSKQSMGRPKVGNLSEEYLHALAEDGANQLSADLKEALQQPSLTDPLQLVVSDALLGIGTHADWNIVASPPDSLLLDPTLAGVDNSGAYDAAKFMQICENSCKLSLDHRLLLITPRDLFTAEAQRTDRFALQAYLQSLSRTGFSLTSAEATMAAANPNFDPALLKMYAKLLIPSATPFLDAPISALVFYGSLSSDQRVYLNKGMKYGVADLTQQQRDSLPEVLLTSSRHIVINPTAPNVLTDTVEPEITDVIGGPATSDERIYMTSRTEQVVRVNGIDGWGRQQDLVFNLAEARKNVGRLAPWQSIQYATTTANTVRFTIHASDAIDVVNFLREYPKPFPPLGPLSNLPKDVQRALQPSKSNRH